MKVALTRRQFVKKAALAVASGFLAACSGFSVTPTTKAERTTAKPPKTPEPSSSPTPSNTAKPSNTPEVCSLDATEELFNKGLTPEYQTVPVLSKNDLGETLGENVDPGILIGITNQINSEVINLKKANPQGLNSVVLPEYIDPVDIQNQLGQLGDSSLPFALTSYTEESATKPDTLLLAVHAGKGGWTVEKWKNVNKIALRRDGSYRVDGLIHTFATTKDANGNDVFGLYSIPGQKIDSYPDIAIVADCGPRIVRVGADEKTVFGVLKDNANMVNPASLADTWTENPNKLIAKDMGPEDLVNKLNELIGKGVGISVTKNDDGSLSLYTKKEAGNNVLWGTVEADTDKIKILTAKNEPYKLKADQLNMANDGNLDISDSKWSGKILEWRDNAWKADEGKILFLAAGTTKFFTAQYGLPTGSFDNGYAGNFFAVLVSAPKNANDPVTVGLYDKEGMLHIYKLNLDYEPDKKIGICEFNLTGNTSVCRIKSKEYVLDVLRQWSLSENQQLGITPMTPANSTMKEDDPTTTLLIKAIMSGDNFPAPPDNYALPVNQLDQNNGLW